VEANVAGGIETPVAGFLQRWNKTVRDFRGNVALFDFDGAHAATKIVFKLLSNVYPDYTDTNCISVSLLIIYR